MLARVHRLQLGASKARSANGDSAPVYRFRTTLTARLKKQSRHAPAQVRGWVVERQLPAGLGQDRGGLRVLVAHLGFGEAG